MSSRAENKTASQFVSLTMRLKDKIHAQKIRRSERIKQTPTHTADLQHTHQGVLLEQERDVVSSLQYFKALVDKLLLDPSVVGGLLGGASSRVLEAVKSLVREGPQQRDSKTVSSCLTRLYLSVAQLISWADHVMLQGVSQGNKESTASVTMVIRAVLDGVKELVRLASERQGDSAPGSPVQSQASVGQGGGLEDQQTSDRKSSCWSPEEEQETPSAPPKPPMPSSEPRLLLPSPGGLSPPALPPKQRHSLSPAPCRVAIVAPMRRELAADRQLLQEETLKRGCTADDTHCEDDPDYHFLLTDLYSTETPPALPEKIRCSTGGSTFSQAPPSFGFESAHCDDITSHCDDVTDPDDVASSPLSPSKTPPPLPEKKRHIQQYLQFCSAYSAPSAAVFYQRPLTFSQRYISQQLTHTQLDTHLETQTSDSDASPALTPAPLLPPKKRQQDSDGPNEEEQTRDSSQRLQQQEEEEEEEQEEEMLLTNRQDILKKITIKPQEEEGPEVKAASAEILLVHASEADERTEYLLYREAFLCTYRSFISPRDVLSRLQRRYQHLSEGVGAHLSAKNTFQLLLRVVEELCPVELDSDLLLLLMDLVFCLLIGGELEHAHLLRSNILSKMEQREQLIGSPQSLRPLAARGVAARPGTLLDFRSQDLAEQLTLLDSELYCRIELPEVLLWSKEQNEEKCPNLTEFTQHFNNVSFWVRSVVILQDKAQDREKLLLKFMKTMKHLRKLNNFNSYLSILSALDSAPLRRLDWGRSSTEALEEFSSLIDSSSSFRTYRAALAEVEPPCIPYLGLILQDLTFVHLGNPDTLMTSQGSKVNFSKRWQQFNILDSLRSYQQVPYSLQPNDDIISFFNDFSDHLAEEALWELSLRLRPRNAPRANQR
ncbi:rap guanine nucleotide exchange factor 1 [Eleginops maclovinus]|uniref:rap guanine nucleotide exchange factor 1 n=1 Tax=Eleginops maclovinus TaxID=56733 RepID=UPI003080F37E